MRTKRRGSGRLLTDLERVLMSHPLDALEWPTFRTGAPNEFLPHIPTFRDPAARYDAPLTSTEGLVIPQRRRHAGLARRRAEQAHGRASRPIARPFLRNRPPGW
jgi:hypothetical protein